MDKRARFVGLLELLAATLLVLYCSDSVTSTHRAPQTPGFALEPAPVAGRTLFVQSGFKVNLFADAIGDVRSLALGPGGAVFVARSTEGDILRLVDTNGDGVPDPRSTVLSGLSYPFGLAFRGDTMYFAEQTAVKRLDPGLTPPGTLVQNLPDGGPDFPHLHFCSAHRLTRDY